MLGCAQRALARWARSEVVCPTWLLEKGWRGGWVLLALTTTMVLKNCGHTHTPHTHTHHIPSGPLVNPYTTSQVSLQATELGPHACVKMADCLANVQSIYEGSSAWHVRELCFSPTIRFVASMAGVTALPGCLTCTTVFSLSVVPVVPKPPCPCSELAGSTISAFRSWGSLSPVRLLLSTCCMQHTHTHRYVHVHELYSAALSSAGPTRAGPHAL